VRATLADRLRRVPEAIDEIYRILDWKSRDEFAADWFARAATERLLEIITEASCRIPDDIKSRETEIPWQRIAHVGNILSRAYPDTDPDMVWSFAKNDLASLQAFVERVVREEDSNGP
jgi:uncharacterized protein with HEPN domain